MSVLWPLARAALARELPAIVPTAKVYDGDLPTNARPARYLTIGWQPATDEQLAGDFEQTPGPSGFLAQETGSVLMELAAVTGDTDTPDVFALAQALTTWVQQHQDLAGALSANATASLSVAVVEPQTRAGAAQRLLLTLTYTSLVT